jgi:alginate O-acetyltransferase complex protein AlgI
MIVSWFHELTARWPVNDFYVSLSFWGCVIVAVLVCRGLPLPGRANALILLACSVGMLLTLPRFTLAMLAVLLGMCLVTYSSATLLQANTRLKKVGTRRLVAAVGVTAILCILVFFKYRLLQETIMTGFLGTAFQASEFIFLIGISYSSFKAMHFIMEGYKRNIQQCEFLSFMNFMLFFPSFISGPINRYNHFCENSVGARAAKFGEDLLPGTRRILDGLFKKMVLVPVLFPYTLNNLGVPFDQMAGWQVFLGLSTLALYFYFDFSGYTDLAIGTARVMGFVLPENFNSPFLKKNIQQLWANWHMSLTSWLTDYIYWPLVRAMRKSNFSRRHPILVSNIAIAVTFFVCGVWHGESFNFVLWGLYHGLGISAVNTYQNWKRKVRSPLARRYFTSAWSYRIGTVMTFAFFALGQSLFVLHSNQLRTVFQRLVGI